MPFFDTTRFHGTLSGHGSRIDIGFDVTVDDHGVLQLTLDRIPFSREAYALHVNQRPGTPVDLLRLEGTSTSGHAFRSESFHISRFNHGSQAGQELSYQGDCYDAELDLPPKEQNEPHRDARVWLVRQFRTFRRIARDTPLGRVIVGGPQQDQDAQEPNGFLAIYRPEGAANPEWWADSERLLTHIARVLSFASDTYLRPVIEQRFEAGGTTVRIAQQGRASPPFMAPFHSLHLEPIVATACDSFSTRHAAIEDLDAAIRWLTAPVAYDESRLVNAMSALENILDRCGVGEVDAFMGSSAFGRVASRVRGVLREIGVPEGMASKVPELNRRSLAEKVQALVQARGIVVTDFSDNWLSTVIRQRNVIVHTGVSGEFGDYEPDTIDHTVWVREVIFRIILERLGFEGAYRSWLHHDEQLRFPECIPMEEWVRRREAAGEPLS